MRIVTCNEARDKFKSILNHQVANDADCTVIVRRDAEDAVMMFLKYFSSLPEIDIPYFELSHREE